MSDLTTGSGASARLLCACRNGVHDDECMLGISSTREEAMSSSVVGGIMHGLFPDASVRRGFIQTVGKATALAAISALTPLGQLTALAQEPAGVLEKKKVNVGFLPITCATPLIYAEVLGLFPREGLEMNLQKTAGVALIRDKMANGELDISQQAMTIPLAMTAGVGGVNSGARVMTILNQNGNALVLAMRHKDNRDPKNWKGFRFAIPFEISHQALQLRYYLASFGLDPDKDVTYRVINPSEYVSNLRVGNIDGFFGGEPGGQRAVYEGAGFIHLLSSEIWPDHPCCAVTATDSWIKAHPNTFMAAYRAVIGAGLHVSKPENRAGMAKILAQSQYLNQPETVVDQVLTGTYADGLGNVKKVPSRVDFQPFPNYSSAVWLLVQMRRWNMIKDDVDYKTLAKRVMLATDAKRLMEQRGIKMADIRFGKEVVMGKSFDSDKPSDYLKNSVKS